MPRPFFGTTAEHLVAVVEAVVVSGDSPRLTFVATFADLPEPQAEAALKLGVDLELLSHAGGRYSVASPLCRFLVTPNVPQRAAVIRVALESYKPFLVFRERLTATANAPEAARQTKAALDLDVHRDVVKDTLLSLGTYSDAILTEGGGRYSAQPAAAGNPLEVLALAAGDQAAAEARIRQQLGAAASAAVSRDDVIVPLANALIRATANDGRGAVLESGNAVESYLTALAGRVGVALAGAAGLNAKIDKFNQWMPTKLRNVGKYVGHVRNAADHGVDTDVNAAWTIRNATGLEIVFVACSFIAAVHLRESNGAVEI